MERSERKQRDEPRTTAAAPVLPRRGTQGRKVPRFPKCLYGPLPGWGILTPLPGTDEALGTFWSRENLGQPTEACRAAGPAGAGAAGAARRSVPHTGPQPPPASPPGSTILRSQPAGRAGARPSRGRRRPRRGTGPAVLT